MNAELLSVRNLSVKFHSDHAVIPAVRDVSFQLGSSEILGIVGESGSGKTTLANAVIRLLKGSGTIDGGEVLFRDLDLLKLSEKEMRRFRGKEIGMIFQDPMQCLDPLMTVAAQIREVLSVNQLSESRADIRRQSIEMLKNVGIQNPERVLNSYPFELSGGMKQRIMIAMALALSPSLLICDEPTTALDVSIQDQIIGLLKREKESRGLSMLFITHNFGIVAELCDRVCVMYGGKIVESGSVDQIFYSPAHPYTQALLKAIPKLGETEGKPLASIEGTPINMKQLPEGCPFHPRCPYASDICRLKFPAETIQGEGHTVCCSLYNSQEGGCIE